MRVGVPKERADGERRVGLVPEVIRKLVARDLEVVVESGAGEGAMLPDAAFSDAGAQIGDPWGADVVVKVSPPSPEEIARLTGDSRARRLPRAAHARRTCSRRSRARV